ncbi:MAG: hypothetical protein WBA57_23225 [Elainellaceae cyanobacterium]
MNTSSQKRRRQFARDGHHYASVPLDTSRLIEQIRNSGKLSRKQHLQLMTALLSNTVQDRKERLLISQILDAAKAKEIEMVN